MPLNKPTHYTLTPKALSDLEEIWIYSAETWSPEQADQYTDDLDGTFRMLLVMPSLARERQEFTPPVRLHVHERHLIVYAVYADELRIIRVLGSRQDWHSILAALE